MLNPQRVRVVVQLSGNDFGPDVGFEQGSRNPGMRTRSRSNDHRKFLINFPIHEFSDIEPDEFTVSE